MSLAGQKKAGEMGRQGADGKNTAILRFFRGLCRETAEFGSFIKRNREGALFSGAAALFVYWGWLTSADITVDSEIMMTDPQSMMASWLGINRFGLVFTKHLFGMTSFVPSVSKVLTVCMLWITAMFFSFCVYKWSAEQKRFLIFSAAFPALYLTAPCFAEQFYFTLQSFEVVFALFLCGAAVYGAGQLVFFRGGLIWGLISVLLMVWAFGTYQAMAAVAVTLTVILFMTVYLSDTGKGRGRSFWFLSGVRLALIFLSGFVLYLLTASLVRRLSGGSEAYVADMVHWKTEGVRQCIGYVKGEVRRVFDCYYVMFRPGFQWILLLFLTISCVWAGRKREKGLLFYLAAAVLFLISPFFMTIVSGYYQPIRAQLVYPLVYGFSAAFLAAALWPSESAGARKEEQKSKAGRRSRIRKGLSLAAVFMCLAASWRQGCDTARLFQTVHEVSEQDTALTGEIYGRAGKMAADAGLDISDCTFIFLGSRQASLTGEKLLGDVIGCSFYQWDAASSMGISRRIYDLMQALNLPCAEPVLSRYLDSLPFSQSMTCYPAEGSIVLDEDTVIVKLSEPVQSGS